MRNLKTLRIYRKLSQSQLATKSGVPIGTIREHERGRGKDSSLSVAYALARALNYTVEILVADLPLQEPAVDAISRGGRPPRDKERITMADVTPPDLGNRNV